MSTPSSTPSRPQRISAAGLLAALAVLGTTPASAQLTVYDPTNYVQNALQAARQLESLTNQAQMLINQARELAASPYSHLVESSGALREIGELSESVRGLAADLSRLEQQFSDLYPTVVHGLAPETAAAQALARNSAARATAEDLARAAAELERLSSQRNSRLRGALSASEGAEGQTAAIQSSTQVLAVLAEDLGSMRAILLAQSRLLAAESARRATERAVGVETRRQFYGRPAQTPPPPAFDPFPKARE